MVMAYGARAVFALSTGRPGGFVPKSPIVYTGLKSTGKVWLLPKRTDFKIDQSSNQIFVIFDQRLILPGLLRWQAIDLRPEWEL